MPDEENDLPQQTPEAAQASDDPAHDRIAAIIKAVSELVTQPPTLLGFDFADLRQGLVDKGLALFGKGEATGENRAIRATDLRRSFQNSRVSLGATRNMHAAWSKASTMVPSRS